MSEEKNLKKLFESKRIELYLRAEVKMLREEIFQLRKERISYNYRLKRKIQKLRKKVNTNTISSKHEDIINETTIIVPVYGQINLFGDLLRDLRTVVENWPLVKIIVVDDKYNESSSMKLKELCEDNVNIRIIENEENLGYLKAVNNAFQNVNTKYVILLNSDVRIPDNWLPRMVKPFLEDSVALATCLATQSGGNLTIDNFTGTNWREVDSLISGLESSNLDDACTAIGYCMALRVSALDGENVYDEIFSPAYGEDSDLHYRVKSKNWRSVVISNLLVHHIGGASYGESEETSQIRERSMNLFLSSHF
jgi:GT2 family glycosyltransferase